METLIKRQQVGRLMAVSFGPGFQDSRSWLYRSEYALITLVIFAFLARTFYLGASDWLQFVFWAIFPDLASFIPIGAASKRREWPSWGANVYNCFHTILIWAAVFAATWALSGVLYLPLLGWLVHITTDRAVGYALRARQGLDLADQTQHLRTA